MREIWNLGETRQGGPVLGPEWTSDGRYILFSEPDPGKPTWNLWRISIAGGKPEKMGLENNLGIRPISVRPDGKEIAYASRGTYSTDSEVWVMENFLPRSEQEEGRIQ